MNDEPITYMDERPRRIAIKKDVIDLEVKLWKYSLLLIVIQILGWIGLFMLTRK